MIMRNSGTRYGLCGSLAASLLLLAGSAHALPAWALSDDFPPKDGIQMPGLLALVLSVCCLLVVSLKLRQEMRNRRQMELESSEKKRRLKAILVNAGVGILLIDRLGRFVDVNSRWCRLFGYRRREARSKLSMRDIFHPDDASALTAHFRSLLAGKIKSSTQERRFLRKDGSVFWGLVSTSTVQDHNGQHKWVVGMITDIDKQKRVEEALRESEERLRFITENTHDIVWQLDRNLCFTYINGADRRMRGFGREEVIGQSLKALIPPSGHATVDAFMPKGALDSDESFEVEMFCKDGSRVWVEIKATPIRQHSGAIIGFIGVTRDATQRREIQEKLREQTIRDPLTGLFNRRYLDESLERELARAKRDNLPLSLLMIDLDHFKKLNDTYGHLAGDEVLKCLGELIRKGARGADLPCRYGGEEFLLVLPNMSLEIAAERAEQWCQAFAEARINFGGVTLSATLSVGVSAYPGHGSTRESLIEAADQALYAAKDAGRNRVVLAP